MIIVVPPGGSVAQRDWFPVQYSDLRGVLLRLGLPVSLLDTDKQRLTELCELHKHDNRALVEAIVERYEDSQ